jgi:RNA recognition motif-containing protein
MATRLYIGNLSYETTETDLRGLFQQAGIVTSCAVISDKFTGKSRGFGFVEMQSLDDAQKAIAQFNGKDFQGRALTVNEARPRDERPRGEGPSFDRSSRDAKRDFNRR